MNDQFGSTDQYATSAMLDVSQAREAPGKNNHGRAKEPMAEIAAMRDYAPEAIALLRQIAANDHLMESEISIVLSWRIRNLLREIDKAS